MKKIVLFVALMTLTGCSAVGWTRAELSRHNATRYSGEQPLNTRSMPPWGDGYTTYSSLFSALGRQYGHSKVIESLQAGFKRLNKKTNHVFVVAEIGKRKGGTLFGHATHKKGLSVDILTPMKRLSDGKPSRLPSGLWNLYGYCWHLDKKHRVWGLKWTANRPKYVKPCLPIKIPLKREVDFQAIRDLIRVMSDEAKKRKGRLDSVIISPAFKKPLGNVGVRLKTGAWVLHDDHIHLDFVF